MTVDKTLSHINVIIFFHQYQCAIVKKSEEFILCIYVTVDRLVQCYLYNWAKFGTICSKMGYHSEQWDLKKISAVSHRVWQTVLRNFVTICHGKPSPINQLSRDHIWQHIMLLLDHTHTHTFNGRFPGLPR